MFAKFPHLKAVPLLAALAVALCLAFAGGASKPASADESQWTRSQSNWGDSSGWKRHWRGNHSGSRSQIIIGGGSGVIISSPGFVTGNSGFVVHQPGFIVSNPGFIVRQPAFIVGQPGFVHQRNVFFGRPQFAFKQKQFFRRHPSLFIGSKPWWHKNWSNKRWKHNRWKHQMHNGMN